jgi:predicted thioesterase
MPNPGTVPHAQASHTHVVGPDDLASVLDVDPDNRYPAVFATTRMIGMMEIAAAKCLVPLLAPGELSVGVVVDVVHTAATLPGAPVTATARFLGMVGKRFRFEVVATDPGGEVGRGHHERAIVAVDRLLDGARKRAGSGAEKPTSL